MRLVAAVLLSATLIISTALADTTAGVGDQIEEKRDLKSMDEPWDFDGFEMADRDLMNFDDRDLMDLYDDRDLMDLDFDEDEGEDRELMDLGEDEDRELEDQDQEKRELQPWRRRARRARRRFYGGPYGYYGRPYGYYGPYGGGF